MISLKIKTPKIGYQLQKWLGLEECMFVMLVGHDSQICRARYPRAPFFCHAETWFVMQNRQQLEAQKLVMLSQHLLPPHDTPPSITSFQTSRVDICISYRDQYGKKRARLVVQDLVPHQREYGLQKCLGLEECNL